MSPNRPLVRDGLGALGATSALSAPFDMPAPTLSLSRSVFADSQVIR
jgi:hypothetical protein